MTAMKLMLVSQRLSRSYKVVVAFVVFVFLATVALRHRSSLPWPLSHSTWPPPDQEDSPPPEKPTGRPIHRPELPPGQCLPEIDFLRSPKLELTDTISYSRRCVNPVWGNPDREVIVNISQPIVTHKTSVDLTSCTHDEFSPCESLRLNVPYPYPQKQYPHLIFGVASRYDRLNASLPAIAHWLAGTGARLIAVVVDANDEERKFNLTSLELEYAAWNVTATIQEPRMKKFVSKNDDQDDRPVPVEHHHFMLIRDLMDHATANTKWLAILDDDTFFPSLYPLDEELSKYDHTKPAWLGALSDDFNHVKLWGFMAFGGAGVFLSMPLAQQIEPLLEKCIVEATVDTGDGILRDCIFTHSRTRLTIVPGLYQHDLLGDVSGFFEGGIRPLSLHHWKSWYREPILAQAAVSALCGDCYLQRWRFGDDTLFANGYSITVYPDALESIDLDRLEGTWEHPGPEYDFSYGPLRPKLPEDKKKSYHLRFSETTSTGALRQIYIYKSNDLEKGTDEVIDLIWEPGMY
jgi:Protein of unknown function, DUF604